MQCIVEALALASLALEVLPDHPLNRLVVEKGDLPIVEIEALWELLVARVLVAHEVSARDQVLSVVVLNKNIMEDVPAGSDVCLELGRCVLDLRILYDVDEEDYDVLQGFGI